MTYQKRSLLGCIQLWLSGAIFGLGTGMVVTGLYLGVMFIGLGLMMTLLGLANISHAIAADLEPDRSDE